MEIKELKCPVCGAPLNTCGDTDIITCDYCKSCFLLEKNLTSGERIIKAIGKEINKAMKYMNSDEYKEVVHRNNKMAATILLITLGIIIAIFFLILLLSYK